MRTVAEGKGLDDLKRDLQYLSRLWSRLKKKAETVKAPGLVHEEVDVSIEVARDLFNDTCESLVVDDPKRHKAIVAYLDKEAPELLPKVHQHNGAEPLFEAYGIEEQIAKALERRVPLPSGGNLVIDHTEALTVIDVNSGRFTGGKGLEDTITKTNLEAAREVVRQLRLRDIGGIIIIDFIDMAHAENRETVLATLEAELETDRTKTYVVELSPLGLVEMTRQNTTDGARGILTRGCPTLRGQGRVLSEETMALRRGAPRARPGAQVAGQGLARRGQRRRRRAAQRAARSSGSRSRSAGASSSRAPRHCRSTPSASSRKARRRTCRRSASRCTRARKSTVELEYRLTYSPRDAVGYVDGYRSWSRAAASFLGERRKVRITVDRARGRPRHRAEAGVDLTPPPVAIISGRCLRGAQMTKSDITYAVVRVGGQQYKVRAGDEIVVDRVAAEEGKSVTYDTLAVRTESGEFDGTPPSSQGHGHGRRAHPRQEDQGLHLQAQDHVQEDARPSQPPLRLTIESITSRSRRRRRVAHKKGAGTSRNGRDSERKRLGVKAFAGQVVPAGSIIVRQRGTKFRPGENAGIGVDHTIFASVTGRLVFTEKGAGRFISVVPEA